MLKMRVIGPTRRKSVIYSVLVFGPVHRNFVIFLIAWLVESGLLWGVVGTAFGLFVSILIFRALHRMSVA
jgi:hypothetical protein